MRQLGAQLTSEWHSCGERLPRQQGNFVALEQRQRGRVVNCGDEAELPRDVTKKASIASRALEDGEQPPRKFVCGTVEPER